MNDPPPAITAMADQFLANAHEQLDAVVAAMREMLSHHPAHIEMDLAHMACALSELCYDNQARTDNLIATYIVAVYELAKQ